MVSLIIPTIILQVSASCFNHFRSTKVARDNFEAQKALEEKLQDKGIAAAKKQYKEMCDLQKKYAIASHKDRIESLKNSFEVTLELEAYSYALESWPLLVPPFVIKRDALSLCESEQIMEAPILPIHCILTPSANKQFNKQVFPKLENYVSDFMNNHWQCNEAQNIVFYKGCWKNQYTDCGSMFYELYAHLSEVPVVVLSPELSDNGWQIRMHWWFNKNLLHEDNVMKPTDLLKYEPDHQFTEDEIEHIAGCLAKMVNSNISVFADTYYWNTYGLPPIFPRLISGNRFRLTEKDGDIKDVKELYENFLCLEGCTHIFTKPLFQQLVYFKSLIGFIDNSDIENKLLKILNMYCTPYIPNDNKSLAEMVYNGDLFLNIGTKESEILTEIFHS